jgi:NO-binding membrane sensor protein with MHYT domain
MLIRQSSRIGAATRAYGQRSGDEAPGLTIWLGDAVAMVGSTLDPPMRYSAAVLITLLLAVPAMSGELFRYRGPANDVATGRDALLDALPRDPTSHVRGRRTPR